MLYQLSYPRTVLALFTGQTVTIVTRLAHMHLQHKTTREQHVLKQPGGTHITTLQPLDILRALTPFDLVLRAENKSLREAELYSLIIRQQKVVDKRTHHVARPTWHGSPGPLRSRSIEGWHRPSRHDHLGTGAQSQGSNHFSNHNLDATIGRPVVIHKPDEVGRGALKV